MNKNYAKVIVDISTMQTNRPFTFKIPESLQDEIELGARVVVPFGKSRKVQGFVVDFIEQSDYDGDIKELISIVDELSPLTTELLDLSSWLSQHIFSFRIGILQTMLPNVMRAKYQRILVPTETISSALKTQLFGTAESLLIDEVTDEDLMKVIKKSLRDQQTQIEYLVKDKAKVKEVTIVALTRSQAEYSEYLTSIPKNAARQIQLVEYIIEHFTEFPIKRSDLINELDGNTTAITTLVKKELLELKEHESYRNPLKKINRVTSKIKLNDEQDKVLTEINQQVDKKESKTFLLEGVTGSGKTEVYLHAISNAIDQGKNALMLVPEISLTPQMVRVVQQRFGNQIAVLHSGLSDGEKYDEWRRIRRNEVKVVIGARSAIFAPLQNIGLIVIDEEHESTYKQEDNPRYHARDVALWRANYHHAVLVLGSATPSLESRARAQKGVYQLLRLPHRVNQQNLPLVKILDLKDAHFSHQQFNLSDELLDNLRETIAKHEQAILLLNRRGFASFMLCRSCGFVLKCPNCDISLTMHRDINAMKCHYCGHTEAIPQKCPNCESNRISFYGAGTQRIQEDIEKIIPEARIIRMDVDTTRGKNGHEKLLSAFRQEEANILLGTQMIAKGLDFPKVTFVGVINADTSLSFPDFRSSEKTFQLLTQVSGRAGRAELAGKVLIQTYNPDHYAIKLAQTQDYEHFYKTEMYVRHQGDYPPYYYTCLLSIVSANDRLAATEAFQLKRRLNTILGEEVILVGPTPKAITKINKQYYYQILVKYKQKESLNDLLEEIQDLAQEKVKQGLYINIDIEPNRFI